MKVSILIAHYNRPNHLRRCLWLLERQTYPHKDMEIVIVDDRENETNRISFYQSVTDQKK